MSDYAASLSEELRALCFIAGVRAVEVSHLGSHPRADIFLAKWWDNQCMRTIVIEGQHMDTWRTAIRELMLDT